MAVKACKLRTMRFTDQMPEPLVPLAVLSGNPQTLMAEVIKQLPQNTPHIEVRKGRKGVVLLCPMSKVWIVRDTVGTLTSRLKANVF